MTNGNNGVNPFAGEQLPVGPPTAAEQRPAGMPASPPLQPEVAPVHEETKSPGFIRRNVGKLAIGAAVVVTLALSANACSNSGNDSSANKGSDTPATDVNSGPSVEACPEGIFTKENPTPFLSEVQPGHLIPNPKSELKNANELYNFLMGNKETDTRGELCMSPQGIATEVTIMNAWVGEDSANARPFGNFMQDANELSNFYKTNPDEADKILNDNKFQSFIDNYQLNEKALKGGSYYRVMVQPDGKIVQQPVDLGEMAPGSIFEMSGDVWFGDSKFTSSQISFKDKSGEYFVLNSIGGIEVIAPDTTTTTAPAAPQEGAEQPANADQQNNSNGGSGEGKTGENGTAGPNGTNPEAGPGGVTDSPGEGGGTSEHPGDTPGTTATSAPPNLPLITVTTRPPITAPPTTRPPVTVPPTTTPPPTTVPPKGTIPPTPTPSTLPGGF